MRSPARALHVSAFLFTAFAFAPAPTAAQSAAVADSVGIHYTTLVAGRDFTCGLSPEGRAFCWGANYFGQLGHDVSVAQCSDATFETSACAPSPLPVRGDHRFTMLSAGEHHACGLTEDGAAWCWGAAQQGQLGPDGGADDCRVRRKEAGIIRPEPCSRDPVLVSATRPFVSIAAGGEGTCALDDVGGVWCWRGGTFDSNAPERVDLPSSYVSLHAGGAEELCAVTTSARLHCWNRRSIEWEGVDFPAEGIRVATVAVGPFHTCVLDEGGRAFCWGSNASGEGGLGFARKRQYIGPPTRVAGGHRFRAIVAAHERTCAIDRQDALYCWGWIPEIRQRDVCAYTDYSASRGYPRECSTRPRRVQHGVRIIEVALGPTHRCALSADGAPLCWGSNAWGALGNGTTAYAYRVTLQGEPASISQVVVAEMRQSVAGLFVNAGAALLVFALLLALARPGMASLARGDIVRIWAFALAATLGLRLLLSVGRLWVIGGMIEGLVAQPLLLALGITGYRVLARKVARTATATAAAGAPAAGTPDSVPRRATRPIGPPSSEDVRVARRWGRLALGAVVGGWLPMLYIWLAPSAFEGLSGDVGLGLAWMMIFGAGALMGVGAMVAVVLAVVSWRRGGGSLVVHSALGLGILTGVILTGAMHWFEYYTM